MVRSSFAASLTLASLVALPALADVESSHAKALLYYQHVRKYPKGRCFAYARYKEGWVFRQLGDQRRALDAFVEVSLGEGDPSPSLRQAARMDLVESYAAVGAPEQAAAFFHRVGGEDAPAMLRRLDALRRAR